MAHSYRIPHAVSLALTCGHGIANAQEPETAAQALTFTVPVIADPADPDPTEQTAEQRTETLRKRTREALVLLDAQDLKSFFSEYVDPFWLARSAAGAGLTVDALFSELVARSPDEVAEMMDRFQRVLRDSLELEPHFLLDGRAASFMEGHSSHTAEFWIYVDGKWRISPET